MPTVGVALAYELMFGIAVPELFRGVGSGVEREIVKRAEALHRRILKRSATRRNKRKLQWLETLLARNGVQIKPNDVGSA